MWFIDCYNITCRINYCLIIFKNKHNVEKTEIPVEKKWIGPQSVEQVTVKLFADGVDTGKTLSEIRNLAYSSDANVRKEAFYKELELYDSIKDSIAYKKLLFLHLHRRNKLGSLFHLKFFSSPLNSMDAFDVRKLNIISQAFELVSFLCGISW